MNTARRLKLLSMGQIDPSYERRQKIESARAIRDLCDYLLRKQYFEKKYSRSSITFP